MSVVIASGGGRGGTGGVGVFVAVVVVDARNGKVAFTNRSFDFVLRFVQRSCVGLQYKINSRSQNHQSINSKSALSQINFQPRYGRASRKLVFDDDDDDDVLLYSAVTEC